MAEDTNTADEEQTDDNGVDDATEIDLEIDESDVEEEWDTDI